MSDGLQRECGKCHRRICSTGERRAGTCSACEVASWSPEKRSAINDLIGLAFRETRPTDAERDAVIDEALRHVAPD